MRRIAGQILTVALALASPAVAQVTGTDSSTAKAGITTGIGIANTADLSFGDMLSPLAAGTVTVGVTNNRSNSASITTAGGVVSSASFQIEMAGGSNPHFYIDLPASVSITSGANSMLVNGFVSNAGTAGGYPAHCETGGTGPKGLCPKPPFTLFVGATLNVGANQAAGIYTGTFDVTVNKY